MKRGSGKSSSLRGGSQRASLITRLISWFDSYVELYTVDPQRIQRALKGYEGTDLGQIWKSVERDVDQIATLPEKSSEVARHAKRVSMSRKLSMIVGAGTFVVLLVYLYFQGQPKTVVGVDFELIIPAVMLALLYGLLMLTILSTRSLNKSMRTFYEQHSGELTKQKSRIREATQQLIDRLSREIYSHDLRPEKFKFQIFRSNYKNITVVGKSGAKFVSTVKIRNQQRN